MSSGEKYSVGMANHPTISGGQARYEINRSGQKTVLEAFRKTLRQELHNIRERPEILWQQMYNRLQWADDEEGERPVSQVIAPQLKKRISPGAKPWLHLKTRLRESGALRLILKGHTEAVHSCTFSPDGRLVASGSGDLTVRLWDAETGSEKSVLSGHTDWVECCAFSPDGRVVASASWDKTVRLWDAQSGSEKSVLSGHTSEVRSCAFSPDGRMVASASEDSTIRFWDAETGKPIEVYPCLGEVECCDFCPLNNKIACGDSGGNLYILELIRFNSPLSFSEKKAIAGRAVEPLKENESSEKKEIEGMQERHKELPESREELLSEADKIRHQYTLRLENLDYPPSDLSEEEKRSWRKAQLKRIEELKDKEQKIWSLLEHPKSEESFQVSSAQKEDIKSKRQTTITCKCGHKNPVGERWCKNCGREL